MKTVFLLFALLVVFDSACVVASPSAFSFTGSTQISQPNVGVYGGIWLNTLPCGVQETNPALFTFKYVAFNFFIDSSNASYYFVKGQAVNTTSHNSLFFGVYIYTNWTHSSPCQGLYGNGVFGNYVSNINVYDVVNLVEGNYTIVATTNEGEAVFGIEFSPATTVLSIQSGLTTYNTNTGPAYYYDFSDVPDCLFDELGFAYTTYTWTPPYSGYFDIYGIVVNSTYINPTGHDFLNAYLSLYNGTLTSNVTDFQINPCQPNFITGTDDGIIVSGLDYVWLNTGWNYTLVVSIYSIYGSVAIEIVPSTFFFVSNPTFVPAQSGSTPSDCSPYTGVVTPWTYLTFTTSYPAFIFAAIPPLNSNYWGYFVPDLYLYSGELDTNPPQTCTDLLQFEGYNLGGQFSDGVNYTLLIADEEDTPSLSYLYSAVHVFYLTGPYVNNASFVISPNAVNITTTSSTSSSASATTESISSTSTGSSSSASQTTTGSVASTTTGVSRGSTTSSPNTSDSPSTFVSTFVLLLITFALLFLIE